MIGLAIIAYLDAEPAPQPSAAAEAVRVHQAEVAEALSAAIWLWEINEAYLETMTAVQS